MKLLIIILLVAIAGIQFFRPEKNVSTEPPGPNDLMVMFPPPASVRAVLTSACYDCHSNHTRYPWYAEIQPVAGWLADHVKEGKSHFNFSAFGTYSPKKQLNKIEDLMDEVQQRNMPLTSYKILHADARLSDPEIKSLADWADDVHEQLDSR